MTEGKLARLTDDLKGEGFHVELFDGWVSHHFYGVEAAKAVRDHINIAADAWASEKVRVAVKEAVEKERLRCAKVIYSECRKGYAPSASRLAAAIRRAPSQPEAKAGEVKP